MDANLTLNVLVCQREIDLCYSAAWPENTSPCSGWVAVCARFDASELVHLLLRLADAPMAPADVSHRRGVVVGLTHLPPGTAGEPENP